MKNILLAGAVIMMCHPLTATAQDVSICSQIDENANDANNGNAVIIGNGEALPEEIIVRLYKFEDGVGDLVAADTIENSQFRFEIPVNEGLTIFSLMIDYPAFPIMMHKLYLTPGAKVEIDAVDNYMFTWPVKSSVPEQTEYELFIHNSKEFWKERQTAHIEYYKKRNKAAIQTMDSISRLIRLRDLELLKTRPVGTVWLGQALDFAFIRNHI